MAVKFDVRYTAAGVLWEVRPAGREYSLKSGEVKKAQNNTLFLKAPGSRQFTLTLADAESLAAAMQEIVECLHGRREPGGGGATNGAAVGFAGLVGAGKASAAREL